MSSFTDIEEEQLIERVEKNPILYDLSHEDFRNSVMKDKVWKRIGQEMEKNGDECKKKWKAIRDGYHRFKKKHKGACEWFAGPKNSKDRRHMLLTFLDDVLPPKYGDSQANHETQEISDDENSTEDHESPVAGSISSIDQSKRRVLCKLKAKRKTMSKPPNSPFMKLMRQRKEQRNPPFPKKRFDDVDLFCGHIAEVLRNLPSIEKAKAKNHLNNILSKYELLAAGKPSVRHASFNVV